MRDQEGERRADDHIFRLKGLRTAASVANGSPKGTALSHCFPQNVTEPHCGAAGPHSGAAAPGVLLPHTLPPTQGLPCGSLWSMSAPKSPHICAACELHPPSMQRGHCQCIPSADKDSGAGGMRDARSPWPARTEMGQGPLVHCFLACLPRSVNLPRLDRPKVAKMLL